MYDKITDVCHGSTQYFHLYQSFFMFVMPGGLVGDIYIAPAVVIIHRWPRGITSMIYNQDLQRGSLVSSRTQGIVYQDWGLLSQFAPFRYVDCFSKLSLATLPKSRHIFTRGKFWPSGIVVACVCLCVCPCVCVNPSLVRAITHDPFQLGSPNLDHRC